MTTTKTLKQGEKTGDFSEKCIFGVPKNKEKCIFGVLKNKEKCILYA